MYSMKKVIMTAYIQCRHPKDEDSIKMHFYKSLVCFVIESSDRHALQQSYLLPTFAVWDSNPMKAA